VAALTTTLVVGCAAGVTAGAAGAGAGPGAGAGDVPTATYGCTGQQELFTVPSGAGDAVRIEAYGAQGNDASAARGGLGGGLIVTVPVQPGEQFAVIVGCQAQFGLGIGGDGGDGGDPGGDGGSGTFVATGSGANLLTIVAGGGGGAGGGDGLNDDRGGDGGAGGMNPTPGQDGEGGPDGGGVNERAADPAVGGSGGNGKAGGNGGGGGGGGCYTGDLGTSGSGGHGSDFLDGAGGGGGGTSCIQGGPLLSTSDLDGARRGDGTVTFTMLTLTGEPPAGPAEPGIGAPDPGPPLLPVTPSLPATAIQGRPRFTG
jgi:hypothetical protein